MDSFLIIILILLIVSIANNLIMYNKCYISRNLPTFDSKLNSTIGFYPINFYYVINKNTSEESVQPNLQIVDNLKTLLMQYQSQNSSNCFITWGNPSNDDYNKINSMK